MAGIDACVLNVATIIAEDGCRGCVFKSLRIRRREVPDREVLR